MRPSRLSGPGVVVAVALVWCSLLQAQDTYRIKPYSGSRPAPTVNDFRPKFFGQEWYLESYSFNGWFDDGSRVYIQYVINNLGLGDFKAGVTMSYSPATGKGAGLAQKADFEEWKYNVSGDFLLVIDDTWIKGNEQGFHIKGKDSDFALDLHFKNVVSPWRPRDGKVLYGPDGADGSYEFMLMAPRADVTGTVTVRGEKKQVKGIGFGDHSTMDVPAFDQSRRWIRLRAYDKRHSVLLAEFVTPPRQGSVRVPWLLITRDGVPIMESYRYLLKPVKYGPDKKYPRYVTIEEYQLEAKSSRVHIKGRVKMTKLLSRYSFVDKLPPVIRSIVRQVIDPMSFTWRNEFDFVLTVDGKDEVIKGEGISEMTYSNP